MRWRLRKKAEDCPAGDEHHWYVPTPNLERSFSSFLAARAVCTKCGEARWL